MRGKAEAIPASVRDCFGNVTMIFYENFLAMTPCLVLCKRIVIYNFRFVDAPIRQVHWIYLPKPL